MISVFTCFSFARSRFLSVTRRTQNRPRLVTAQMCVNPRNENVSGFPSPRAFLLGTAYRPNCLGAGDQLAVLGAGRDGGVGQQFRQRDLGRRAG